MSDHKPSTFISTYFLLIIFVRLVLNESMSRRLKLIPIAGFFLAWLILFRPLVLGGPASYIIVSGDSMFPTLLNGDLAVLQRQEVYEQGDVIAFNVPGGIVIHRIIDNSNNEGYLTQGDNNNGTDPWEPQKNEILGKVWFSVSGGGRFFEYIRQPFFLAALAGLSIILIMDGSQNKKRIKRRGRWMNSQNIKPANELAVPTRLIVILIAFFLFTVLLTILAVYSFRIPLEKKETVEKVIHEHSATFDYTLFTEPSILYPEGLVKPNELSLVDESDFLQPVSVFTYLARSLDINFSYELKDDILDESMGEMSVVLEIMGGENGWTQKSIIVDPIQFTGSTISTQIFVDFAQILSLINAIEEETGFNPRTYDISIIPTVNISGGNNGEIFHDEFAPRFNMRLDKTRIILDSELTRSELYALNEEITTSEEFRFLGLSFPVSAARLFSLTGLIFCLGIISIVIVYIFFGPSINDAARFHTRYGGMIVSITDSNYRSQHRITVASPRDLVRIAQRDGRVILHQEIDNGSNLYFIPDGEVIYSYQFSNPTV